MGHASAPLRDACQNCGTPLQGPFCHRCGQKDFDFHRSFGHVVHEALETWFHIDGSFLRGFHDLLFRPGLMTRDFNEGRRARHVPPLRFYLVISVVFFLVMQPDALPNNLADAPQLAESGVDVRLAEEVGQFDKPPLGTFARTMVDRAEEVVRNPNEPWQAFFHALPKMLLVCLPVLALFTRALYRRGPWTYLQHLILSVHLHTFVYLWSLVVSGWKGLFALISPTLAVLVGFAAILYAAYYYFATLRRALGTSRRQAIAKGLLGGAAYGLTLSIAFLITVVVAFLWL